MGQVRVGTASWTDRTLIEAGWYLPEAKGKAATSTSGPAGDSYSETELREWAPQIAALARDTGELTCCSTTETQLRPSHRREPALRSAGHPS